MIVVDGIIVLTAGSFAFAHYWLAGREAAADRRLQAVPSANWAACAEAAAWLDFVLFGYLLLDAGLWHAAVLCGVPSVAGSWLGKKRSIEQEYVINRMRAKAKRERELLRKASGGNIQADLASGERAADLEPDDDAVSE